MENAEIRREAASRLLKKIQLEVDKDKLDELMARTGAKSRVELFNRALTQLKLRKAISRLTPEQFIYREEALSTIRLRERIVRFLFWAYGFAILVSFGLFYLKGLDIVNLSDRLMNWLGGAVLGELAGLFALVIKSVFPQKKPW